jgi:hypothetical protein
MSTNISTNVASHKALDELKNRGFDHFTLRPWNYHKPENTLWWLVPSKEWPSYKYGKIAIYKPKNSEEFRVGFHLEKGISSKAGQMLSQRTAEKLCIKSDWVWHKLVEDIKSGKFEEILQEISNSVNSPIKLYIQASAIKDKESSVENFEGLELNNIIEFIYDGSVVKCVKANVKGEFRKYDYIDTIEGFIEIFEAKDMEWFWIDFFAVVEIPNSDWHQIETIVPSFIEHYRGIF